MTPDERWAAHQAGMKKREATQAKKMEMVERAIAAAERMADALEKIASNSKSEIFHPDDMRGR